MIVDAHQHFWRLDRSDYGWLQPQLGILYRDYLPQDFEPLLGANDVGATVLVQAAATENETRYLLELATAHPFIAGVVGWVEFEADDAAQRMAALVACGHGRLKGLRPMLQDIADPQWILRPQLDAAFAAFTTSDGAAAQAPRSASHHRSRWQTWHSRRSLLAMGRGHCAIGG